MLPPNHHGWESTPGTILHLVDKERMSLDGQECKLCLRSTQEVGPLQKSHIIPRFMTKLSQADGQSLVFDTGPKKYRLSQEDWKEKMLCKACEYLTKQRCEDPIKEALFLRRKTSAAFEDPNQLALLADVDLLALAFISIFWRAVVARHGAFLWACVPGYISDDMRTWVHTGTMGKNWSSLITIKLQELRTESNDTICFLMPAFCRNVTEAMPHYQFVLVFGGYCLTLSIPPKGEQFHFRDRTFRPGSKILRVERVHYEQIPEIKQTTDHMTEQPLPEHLVARVNVQRNRRARRQ